MFKFVSNKRYFCRENYEDTVIAYTCGKVRGYVHKGHFYRTEKRKNGLKPILVIIQPCALYNDDCNRLPREKIMTAPHIQVGRIGEQVVANHLERKGYSIRCRNYRKKWGEIDIVAEKESIIHFIEVKTVSRETDTTDVSHETWLPEENVGQQKLQRIFRTIETWLIEYKYSGEWQLDVASVWINTKERRGRIKTIENVL